MLAKAISANLSRLYCGLFVGILGIRVEEQSTRFIVRDHNGQALADVFFEDELWLLGNAHETCSRTG